MVGYGIVQAFKRLIKNVDLCSYVGWGEHVGDFARHFIVGERRVDGSHGICLFCIGQCQIAPAFGIGVVDDVAAAAVEQ